MTASPRWRRILVALALTLGLGGISTGLGCIQVGASRGAKVPMGSWSAWQDLTPLIEVASAHLDKETTGVLKRARVLLREGKAKSADAVLASAANGGGRHWIAVARADLASLYFTKCIRGVAWRLPDDPEDRQREVDYDPATKVLPGDLSVEALLTNLDNAIEAGKASPALATQARIARVRVAGFAASCPANPEVERRAATIMNADLATLAAENHLTPDLAYMWAGVQLQTYSGAAARPFLLQALEGGFDDPSVSYMLAAIAFEQSELEEAERLASEAAAAYLELGDPGQQAQVAFLRGEIALTAGLGNKAEGHYNAALQQIPNHAGAMLGLAEVERDRDGPIAAVDHLAASLRDLTLGHAELDEARAFMIVDDLESFVIIANAEPIEIAQISRDALLLDIELEPDPFRRGLRFFYAAVLEVRLGDYPSARGHAATAELEFEDTWVAIPDKVDPRGFLDRLAQASP